MDFKNELEAVRALNRIAEALEYKNKKKTAISIQDAMATAKSGDLYSLKTLVNDPDNIGMLISWKECDRWATALMTGVNWFSEACNLERDGDMEGEDADGYFNRTWVTDQFYDWEENGEALARFATPFERKKWVEKCGQ